MNESNEEFRESDRDILEYLSSLRLLTSDLDVEVKTAHYSGCIQVRGGAIVAASVGDMIGNGALFTLVTQGLGEITSTRSEDIVVPNVTVNYDQIVHIVKQVSSVSSAEQFTDEAEALEEAVHLFLQFRRKEAGARLVEILRNNRFYYPAWLWHSRLMNRAEYLQKAVAEMKKWGGHDAVVQAELAKIEPQLIDKKGAVKRCIFCWAIVETGQEYCSTCNCCLSISAKKNEKQGEQAELKASLKLYDAEFTLNPENSRIAYCLCLGNFSLGDVEAAQGYLDKALVVSPKEQLFQKTARFLNNLTPPKAEPVVEQVVPKVKATTSKQPVTTIKSVPASAPVKAAAPVSTPSGAKTILVIEDSNTSRKVISMVLTRQGYNIVEATTGGEAISRLVDVMPDLVLLDVMLPDMDGYQVLSEIRSSARLKDVPVVMLTGKRGSTDRMKGLSSGANEYLTKPFDPAKLVKVLDRFVKSTTAKTAKVSVRKVPVVKAAQPGKRSIKATVKPALQATPLKPVTKVTGPSILIVEDSPTTRKVISMVLTRQGYPLREAVTGKEALAAIESKAPELILLDAMLPDMSGYSLLTQLQKSAALKKIPVVMLTAKTGATDRQKGMQAGAVAYLTKPFDPNKLLTTVAQHLPASFLAAIKK
ncbi:response regulator [Desulforhopalus sp. 52FAK]